MVFCRLGPSYDINFCTCLMCKGLHTYTYMCMHDTNMRFIDILSSRACTHTCVHLRPVVAWVCTHIFPHVYINIKYIHFFTYPDIYVYLFTHFDCVDTDIHVYLSIWRHTVSMWTNLHNVLEKLKCCLTAPHLFLAFLCFMKLVCDLIGKRHSVLYAVFHDQVFGKTIGFPFEKPKK